MQEFFASPILLVAAALACFLAGWLLRQTFLNRRQLAATAILERDRDYARSEAKKQADQVGLLEADLKKAAFDAGQLSEKILGLKLEKSGLSDALHHAAVREAKMLAERSESTARSTALEEQVLGLRAKSAELLAANARLVEHEEAQKRLRADCGAALTQLNLTRAELEASEKSRAELIAETERLRSKIERLKSRPIPLPTVKPFYENGSANGQNGSKTSKNGSTNGFLPPKAEPNGHRKSARKSLISAESAAALDPVFLTRPVLNGFADDLKIINGIGPREEKALAELGVSSIEKLAEMTSTDVAELAEGSASLMKKLEKEGWQAQARHLVGAVAG